MSDMLEIPAGPARLGHDEPGADHHPAHEVRLERYWIDKHPVTNSDYADFVAATGHRPPLHWAGAACPAGWERLPVVNVDWHDAAAYAAWAGKRLPSEAEWEKAARGEAGLIYPWGNAWRDDACALECDYPDEGGAPLIEIGRFPTGASPYGVEDLLGGVWEWTADWYDAYPGGRASLFCGQKYRVIRGGAIYAYYSFPRVSAAYHRGRLVPYGRNAITGFRCARD